MATDRYPPQRPQPNPNPHPNDTAERLTGRRYLSWSAITTYASCPLRYYFRYVEDLPERAVSSSLVFGSAIHHALEFHFQELLAGAGPPPLDGLLQAYHDGWGHIDAEEVLFGKTEDMNSLDALASRMLSAFQASDLASPAGRVLAIEEELTGELVPGCPDLLARLDLVIDAGDTVNVTDYKTARSPWTSDHVQDSSGQLLLYHELVKPLADGRPVALGFTVITKAKTPVVEWLPVPVNPWKIARTKRIFERIWKAIQAGHFYPSPSPMQCPSCPFREECRNWSGK